MEPLHDENLERELRVKARKRVEFKQHLLTYLVINALLWTINYLTMAPTRYYYWWALWPTLIWGVGLILHGFFTYSGLNEATMVEREYERLKRRQGGRR